MTRTLTLLTVLAGCAPAQTWGHGYNDEVSPPREDLAGYYQPETEPDPEKERCLALIDQYYKDLAEWEAAQAQVPAVTDEEREEFAHQQGEARQDDLCFVRLRESRQGATYVQVPCGRPAKEYRSQKGMLRAPHLPRECEQYDERAVEEANRAYQEMSNGQ